MKEGEVRERCKTGWAEIAAPMEAAPAMRSGLGMAQPPQSVGRCIE